MNRKLIVLGLAIVLAIALVVPSLARPTSVSPRVSSALSQRAIAKARTAVRVSRGAKRQSRAAEELAQNALGTAKGAAASAAATQAALDATHVVSATAAASATTLEESFVPRPGGPSVTVKAPASGLIEVWAQATMDEAGVVSLYEDGKPMPGQDEAEICGPPGGGPWLFGASSELPEPMTLATPGIPGFPPFCGTIGAPASVLFQTTPGTHTYELRYASCGCKGVGTSPVTFSDRRLYVAPRL